MNNTKQEITSQIIKSIEVKQALLSDECLVENIEKAVTLIVGAHKADKKTFFAGNGGSAADAQHLAGELVGRFNFDRPGLAALALTTNTTILTAVSNDYGFKYLFARQLQALGNVGDVFVGISTSGNSGNIVEALKECRKKGIRTIGLTGSNGGAMNEYCDLCLKVPSEETPRVQEAHILIGHIICSQVEKTLFGKYARVV